MKELTLEEIDDLEAKYPPLVGNRTQVFLEPQERMSKPKKGVPLPNQALDRELRAGSGTIEVLHEQTKAKPMSSEELAHVLNGLLTPVQTFLRLCGEARLNQETIDELRPMCLRNLETVRSYVSKAPFFQSRVQRD